MSVRRTAALALVGCALLAGSCGGEPPQPISDWGLFQPGTHEPMPDLVPYEIVAPLFSDYAAKYRFIRLPEGARIDASDPHWTFPVDTVLVKTFAFPIDARDPSLGERIVETRLLHRESETRWRQYVYVWNAEGTEAFLEPAGRVIPVTFVDGDGDEVSFDYRVPSHTQCRNCHAGDGPVLPIGPRTSQMHALRDFGMGEIDQIDHFDHALALFDVAPTTDAPLVDYRPVLDRLSTATDEEIEAAAFSYLHANCAHCHREDGPADQSGLWLSIDERDDRAANPARLGLCRLPIAGGCSYGSVTIRPGHPEDSILMCRLESTMAGERMPELPSVLVYEEGIELVREWIRRMPEDCTGAFLTP